MLGQRQTATPPLIPDTINFKALAISNRTNVNETVINSVADPVLNLDAANKEYVDEAIAAGRTVPGGQNGDIQFNDNGVFGGTSGLSWNRTEMGITGNVSVGTITSINSVMSSDLVTNDVTTNDITASGVLTGQNGKAIYQSTSTQSISASTTSSVQFPSKLVNTFGSNLGIGGTGITTFINKSTSTMYMFVNYTIQLLDLNGTGYVGSYIQNSNTSTQFGKEIFAIGGTFPLSLTGSCMLILHPNDSFQIMVENYTTFSYEIQDCNVTFCQLM